MSETLNIPIIFVHFGNSWYLEPVLRQAKKLNQDVYLLTDQNVKYDGIQVVDINKYMDGVDDFTSVYKHMSSNGYWIEHLCIVRWKIILNFLQQTENKAFAYLDSDILVFDDLTKVFSDRITKNDVGILLPDNQREFQWSSSAHSSYMTIEGLKKVWSFMLEQYTDKDKRKRLRKKYTYHLKNKKPGGICDMTLFYLYAQENDIDNLLQVKDGTVFDDNINSANNLVPDEYVTRQEKLFPFSEAAITIKDFAMKDGKPVVKNLLSEEDVVFNTLHFQGAGGAKELIKKLA